jgi:hypothetical protein
MKTSNFALRLQPTLMEEARELAKAEGVALNQLINVAVAEKLAVARTREFFSKYTREADIQRALDFLARAGADNPPMPGDELPKGRVAPNASGPRKAQRPAKRTQGRARADRAHS